jgi:hypothetical protein
MLLLANVVRENLFFYIHIFSSYYFYPAQNIFFVSLRTEPFEAWNTNFRWKLRCWYLIYTFVAVRTKRKEPKFYFFLWRMSFKILEFFRTENDFHKFSENHTHALVRLIYSLRAHKKDRNFVIDGMKNYFLNS